MEHPLDLFLPVGESEHLKLGESLHQLTELIEIEPPPIGEVVTALGHLRLEEHDEVLQRSLSTINFIYDLT